MTQLDPLSATPGDVIIEIPIDQVEPNPNNRPSTNLDGLAASIRDVGILQPILVTRDNGHYRIIAGERRWRAATIADLDVVPAIVRDDLADDIADEMQLVENLQREDLDPLYEAAGYQRLLAHDGWNQRVLAERVGVSQSHISKRLQLLELPAVAQKALGKADDSGGITVSEALELVKLKDDPKLVAEIIKSGDVEYAVDQEVRRRENVAAIAKVRAELEAAGVTILDDNKYRGKYTRIDQWSGINVDKTKHKKEPCHAVVIRGYGYGKPDVIGVCTNPARHATRGESTLKIPKGSTSRGPGKSDAQCKKEAAEREANTQRRAFIHEALFGTPPKDFWDRMARRYVDDAAFDERKKICDLLDIIAPERSPGRGGGRDYVGAVDEYAGQSRAHLAQVAYAFMFVQGEWSWSKPEDHYELLLELGYVPHAAEKADFAKAAKR